MMKIIIILLIILAAGGIVVPFLLAGVLYTILFVRTGKDKWSRKCSMPSDPEQQRIYDLGWEWHEANKQYAVPVEIENDGLKLVGEYYDFGFDRAAIIVVGRTETLLYSYYYVQPYKELGFNVLVFDNRAHGLSEGRKCYLAYREYRDVLAWAKLVHESFGMNEIHLHGLCIGSSSCLFALISPECPDYIRAMVADGMYATFSDTFAMHVKERGHALFPIFYIALLYVRIFSHADIWHDGPVYRVDRLKKPILFIHSRKDQYSEPEKLKTIFERCNADKTLEWFDKGGHSRVRINNTEKYDLSIAKFVEKIYTRNENGK